MMGGSQGLGCGWEKRTCPLDGPDPALPSLLHCHLHAAPPPKVTLLASPLTPSRPPCSQGTPQGPLPGLSSL